MLRSPYRALSVCFAVAACAPREVPIAPEPDRVPAPDERAVVAPPRPGNPEVPIPRPSNGVLPPGAADKILAAGAPPIVRLLEPGVEPRADLGYALTKGASQKIAMGTDMTVAVRAKGQSLPQMPVPRITVTMDTTAADKNAAGEFRIESRFANVAVDPNGAQQEQMARALRPQLEALRGLAMAYWVNAKGQVRDVKLDIPATVPAAAQQMLGGMSRSFEATLTPLPQEPVGVGARWQVVSRLSSGGADLLQSAVYTLKSRSGSRAALDVSLFQVAASDSYRTPQMPAGMSIRIKTFSSGGTGTTNLDLKSIVPEGGNATLKSAMEIAVPGAGADGESAVETTTSVVYTRP